MRVGFAVTIRLTVRTHHSQRHRLAVHVATTWPTDAGTVALAHEDVIALVAFLGDCADAAVVDDVSQSLAAMLATSSFVRRPLTAVCQARSHEEAVLMTSLQL